MYSNIRVLFIIGCPLPVSSAESERSFSGLQRIKSYLRNRMSDERLSGLALMHLYHDLDIDVDEICTIFVTKHKRRMFQGCATGGRGCEGCGGEVICLKRVQQSFLNQSLDPPPPPNQKFLDPPLPGM